MARFLISPRLPKFTLAPSNLAERDCRFATIILDRIKPASFDELSDASPAHAEPPSRLG